MCVFRGIIRIRRKIRKEDGRTETGNPEQWGAQPRPANSYHSLAAPEGPQEHICELVGKTGETKASLETNRAFQNWTAEKEESHGRCCGRSHLLCLSLCPGDFPHTQPGMKPGSRVNQRPTSRKKQSRTLISAKERGPSPVLCPQHLVGRLLLVLLSRLRQPQDRLEEAKMTGWGERVGWARDHHQGP